MRRGLGPLDVTQVLVEPIEPDELLKHGGLAVELLAIRRLREPERQEEAAARLVLGREEHRDAQPTDDPAAHAFSISRAAADQAAFVVDVRKP